MWYVFSGVAAALAFASLQTAHAQQSLPKPVAQTAINYHLANRLADECSTDIEIDTRAANMQLRALLAKEDGMSLSTHGFGSLLSSIGPELIFGAETVYFDQMDISRFDRASFCRAAKKAVEEQQQVGQFLKPSVSCDFGSTCTYFQ